MLKIEQTPVFQRWLAGLRDRNARARIDMRVKRLTMGNPGDTRFVGGGVLEMKIDYGPGYRVYYMRAGREIVLLLAGGDKRTQSRDIETAIGLAQERRAEP